MIADKTNPNADSATRVAEGLSEASRIAWIIPEVTPLPRLSELTLQSPGPIPGGGGTGGGGSTVIP